MRTVLMTCSAGNIEPCPALTNALWPLPAGENPPHEATVRDLRNVLSFRFPGWFVTGNVCIYWQRGNTKKYRATDLLLVKEPLTEEVHRVYLTWKQPPVTFVA